MSATKTLSPNEKLDAILFFFKNEKRELERPPIDIFYLKSASNCDIKEVEPILNKLVDDGLIEKTQIHPNYFKYKIKFEGILFNGYINKSATDLLNEKQIKLNMRLMTLGTWLAAIFAGMVFAWQVWIWFYPVHKDYPYWFWQKVPTKTVYKKAH